MFQLRQPLRALVSFIVIVPLLISPHNPFSFSTAVIAQAQQSAKVSILLTVGLYRTLVSLPNTTSRARLDQLEVVVLDEGDDWALVLADGDQLETLARLGFKPRASDDLGQLAEAHTQTAPWLAQGLQPLLTQATMVYNLSREVATVSAAQNTLQATELEVTLAEAEADLRTALHALTPEQLAGIESMTSIDDDGDGLTNTQEAWWCTDPLNPDSDGDGASDSVEVQAAKDWLGNLRAGPPSTGKPFAGWPPDHAGCYDDDMDSIPDMAERWELGLNMNRESTDRDKFDDGQELFGNTYCPGSSGYCGYGALPRNEDWGVIFAEMPAWVEAPGNHPFAAAFPIPEIDVVESSLHVETVTVMTTDHSIAEGTEESYSTAKTEGTSTSIANTETWNEWQEVSESRQQYSLNVTNVIQPTAVSGVNWGKLAGGTLQIVAGVGTAAVGCGAEGFAAISTFGVAALAAWPVCAGGIAAGVSLVGSGISDLGDAFTPDTAQTNIQVNQYQNNGVQFNGEQTVILNQCSDTDNAVRAIQDTQYSYLQNGEVTGNRLYEMSYVLPQPVKTTTNTQGRSWGGAQTTTHEQYEEHTITNGEAFSSEESWGTATAVDSSHTADLWFTYAVQNSGTEYAREIGDLAFNIYIGDDPNPAYTYFVAPDLGGDGKFHNFMPGEEHTYTSHHIPLTLQQMAAIDLGGPIRIVVEDYTYGIDELFYQDAANAGVQIAMEDGATDGDEAIDNYLIPTWGEETVLDVVARYFPHTTDADGTLIAIWTPEYRADTPAWCQAPRRVGTTLWCQHALSTADWWNVYTDGLGDGTEGFQDTPAAPGSVALFRFNKDADLDGYSDRSEAHLGTDPDDPASHPNPELLAGLHSIRVEDNVTATLSLLNTGLYDAYGVEAVMIAPSDAVSITNNTVGGSGRVRALKDVVVGSHILPPAYATATWQGTAQPFSAGYYVGSSDRIYTFTALGAGDVSAGTLQVQWNDGVGASGTLNVGSGYASPTPLNVGSLGVQVGFLSGGIQAGDTFTVAARTPRDTFQYIINEEPYPTPVVLVSYNDPQGNHRFVTPVTLATPIADLMPYSGQMLDRLGLEIVTQAPVTTTGSHTANLVVNWPVEVTLEDAHLFLEFINISGTVVSEIPVTVTLPPGPTVVPVAWDTGVFSPAYQADEDYIVMAFWTDWQGNIIDTAGRPLSSFQEDPKPAFAMASEDVLWDFGDAAQGTVLKRAFDLANTGYLELLTYVNAPAGVTLSQQGSRRVGPADVTTYEIMLNTSSLTVGPYSETITIRSSDPESPLQTVHVMGNITAATPDIPVGALQRPLDWPVTLASGTQGQWIQFTHTLGPTTQTLHPVKVYSQNYATLWGVGKYATSFNTGTYSPDMFGDGRDGSLVVVAGQTYLADSNRASVSGTAYAGQQNVYFTSPSGGVSTAYLNYWPKYDWFDTGLVVAAGDHIVVVKDEHGNSSLGKICYGSGDTLCYMADGISETAPAGWNGPGLRKYSLIGRIGNGSPFYVGKNYDGYASGSGPLYLGLNDCTGCCGDNTRSWWFNHQVYVYPSTTAAFTAGDLALVIQMTGTNAGQYELAKIAGAGSGWVSLSAPLQNTYSTSGDSTAQIIRVPQFTNVTVQNQGAISAHSWSGTTGGVVAFLVRDQLTIQAGGKVFAFAIGFNGGRETAWASNAGPAYQGASYTGASQQLTRNPNAGGGGGGQNEGGGGGGYGTAGQDGNYDWAGATPGLGGSSYGTTDLSTVFLGSGGGGSGHVYESAAQGGKGGGIVYIIAKSSSIAGGINAGGQGGWQGPYGGDYPAPTSPAGSTRNGGGGAGGSVRLVLGNGSLGAGLVTALGGLGGQSTDGGGRGGNGGDGRIRVEYCESVSGTTNPAASTQKLNCYIVEQVETSPYTSGRLNLPETFTNGRTYQVQYGRRLVFGGAGEQTSVLRVPSGAFTDVRFDALVSEVGTGTRTFRLDIGNDGSWDWEWTGSVTNAITLNSANLSAAFSRYWVTHGAPTSGTADVPVRVYLSQAGQVLLTNLQVTPTGSKVRYARLPAQTYTTVTLNLSVGTSGSGPLTVAADVGDNGSVDWTYTATSITFPLAQTTGNLAEAFNAYLAGHTGEVAVPVRFYVTPFVAVSLKNFSVTPTAKPDLSLMATDITFGVSTPTESDIVPITATLHNNGALAATGHTVAFYATVPEWGEWYIGSAFVPGIPAGGAAQANIPWDTLGFTGATTVRAVVDPYNRLAETNEDNNQATASLTILTRPDLEPAFAQFSNPEPVAGETITVTLQVQNHGQTAAGAFAVGFYNGNPDDDGALLQTVNLTVSGGGATVAAFTWTPTTPGPYRLFALVDKVRAVNESNRGNNLTWQDVYAGLAGPLLLDSGGVSDPGYTSITGYGVVDEGQPDVFTACGSSVLPEETLRRDPDGRVVYRFDHLLPGHFYHLDVTLYECDGAGRQESIYVDSNLIAGPVNLIDGEVHRLSLRLDPALYADRTISVIIEEPGIDGAIVSEVNLHDIDYRYADAGGGQDPSYPGSRNFGWLDGVASTAWGTLPYQSVRVDQGDNRLRYRFDGLLSTKQYLLNMTFYQGSGTSRQQRLEVDGLPTGIEVDSGDYVIHRISTLVPLATYVADGSAVVSIVRTNASVGAMVNEIAIEELTQITAAAPHIQNVRVTNITDNSFTVSWTTDVTTTGYIHYGASSALGQIAYDARGSTAADDTHYVTLSGLTPNTPYNFDLIAGQTVDNNNGQHYEVTTAATLALPPSDTTYGQVQKGDGGYAGGSIVYVQVTDSDGLGNPGQSRWLSALVDGSNGYWYLNLGQARLQDGSAYFSYSPAGDTVVLEVEGANDCRASASIDTSEDSPAPTLHLACTQQASLSLASGWNLRGLPLQLLTPLQAEAWLDDIAAQGGNCSEVDRWLNGGWDAHLHNLPFNDYAIVQGQGYFLKGSSGSTWSYEGKALTAGVPLALQPGWNLINVPYPSSGYTAQSLLNGINGTGCACSEIDRWLNGGWDAHINGLPFNDFPIAPDAGYFVKCTVGCSYTPGQGGVMSVMPTSSPAALPLLSPGEAPVVEEVRITNLRDVALSVVWRTDVPSVGTLSYGETDALGSIASDDRGAGFVSTIHQATLTRLQPETQYFVQVLGEADALTEIAAVHTLATGEEPALPYTVYGQVVDELNQPVVGTLTQVEVLDASGQVASTQTAVVDGWGYWVASLPLAECAGIDLRLTAYGPAGGYIQETLSACAAQPAVILVLPDTTHTLYLPLVMRQ